MIDYLIYFHQEDEEPIIEETERNTSIKRTYMEKGEASYSSKNYKDAMIFFYEAIKINSYDPKACFMYGKCLYKLAKQTNNEKLMSGCCW